MIVGGIATWFVVSDTLADQKITTSDDACLPGRAVTGPFTAYCQAKVIEQHSLGDHRGPLTTPRWIGRTRCAKWR